LTEAQLNEAEVILLQYVEDRCRW